MGGGPRRLRINLLGGFGVEIDGADADSPWRLRKAKTLVKLLALAPGHQQHREVLVEELWPDLAAGAGANNFHQVLHAARRVLGADRLVLRDDIVVLTDDVTVDLDEFHAAAAHALATRDAADLGAALEWWRGELLPEDRYEDWTTADRDRADAVRTTIAAELGAVL